MPTTGAVPRAGAIPTGEWAVDRGRSSVAFTLKHLLFTKVTGHFREFEGSLSASDEELHAAGSVQSASLDTKDAVRDQHVLESPDFFDAANHPEISFASTRIEGRGNGRIAIAGELQIRGVSRGIELDGTSRPLPSRAGEPDLIELRLGCEVDRREFGLTWNQKLDTGGAMLGNRVKIELEVVLARQPGA